MQFPSCFQHSISAMNSRVACLIFFRAFSLDPHIPGRSYVSALLCLQSLITCLAPVAILFYAFFVLHMFAEPSMLAVLSASFIGCMLSTQSFVVANALWHRRELVTVRGHLAAADNCLAMAASVAWDSNGVHIPSG